MEEGDVFECVLVEADRRLGRERETSFADIFSPQSKVACPYTSFFDVHFAKCTNATYLLVETDCVFTAPRTFPFLSVMFCHTLPISRDISLTVSDHQR